MPFDLKVLVQFIATLEKCATGAPLETLLEIMIITSTLIPSKAPQCPSEHFMTFAFHNHPVIFSHSFHHEQGFIFKHIIFLFYLLNELSQIYLTPKKEMLQCLNVP